MHPHNCACFYCELADDPSPEEEEALFWERGDEDRLRERIDWENTKRDLRGRVRKETP